MVANKPHPLKGRKLAPETIAKRKATYAAKRAAREAGDARASVNKAMGTLVKRAYNKRKPSQIETRTHERLLRDVKEAIWCLEKAVASKRRAIAAGTASLTDVTDEETFMYMAARYLQGGLR